MLHAHTLLSRDGVELADVACRHAPGSGGTEQASAYGIVFVRRGCFVRSADGAAALFDPTAAYCMSPGQEQRYDHPHSSGDDCTALFLAPDLAASLWGGDPALPKAPLQTAPAIDLEHRLLLAAARRGADHHEVVERALALAASVLEQAEARRVQSGRPASVRERRAIGPGARRCG
jgi:hypothetical protein